RVQVSLPVDVTSRLLTVVPAAFHAGVNDVLLAGLAAALAGGRGVDGQVLVDVEGHGRQALAEGMDLSRTVGWFTIVYPVWLDVGGVEFAEVVGGGPAAGRVIKRAKEQLRRVPGDGLGYGLLRYLNPVTAVELAPLATAQIGFNYLGRFSGAASAKGSPAEWQPIARGGYADGLPATHVLEAGGAVRDAADGPRLTVTVSWPAELLEEPDVQDLADRWVAVLGGFTEHMTRPDAGGHTPSDFPLLDLGQRQVERLEALAEEI